MSNESLIENSMSILINSGEARNLIKEAYDNILENKYDLANKCIKEAHKYILEAHKKQTDEIQKEASGDKIEYSLLFSHAQDTMMTINSEFITCKKMLKLFKNVDDRLKNLEEKLD